MKREPTYCLHKASGRAYIFKNGKNVYLPGAYGSPESRAAYYRELSDWHKNGGAFTEPKPKGNYTIGDIVDEYLDWFGKRKRQNGQHIPEYHNVQRAMRFLEGIPLKGYGAGKSNTHGSGYNRPLLAESFGHRELDNIVYQMIQLGHYRQTINRDIVRIRACFKHAAGREMISPNRLSVIKGYRGITKGYMGVTDSPGVRDVEESSTIQAIKPYVSRQVWAMVQLQSLPGLATRAGEITRMRACDIDMTQQPWVYTPPQLLSGDESKTREPIPLGPEAQKIIKPFLPDPALVLKHPWVAENYLFSPMDAQRERYKAMRAARKTPVQPSQVSRAKRNPRRQPGPYYTVQSYGQAIRRACIRAGVKFTSHQLRHTAATVLREITDGMEASQLILRHKTQDATSIYAHASQRKRAALAMKYG